jgi:hypothetical protein
MSIQKYGKYCTLCKEHLKGKKQIKLPEEVINLEEKGEALCNLCERKICNKNFNLTICQEIKKLKMANISLKERMELEELEQELAKLTTKNTPSPKRQVSQELKQMEEQLDEEEEFKRLDIQAKKEMRKSPRKSLVKGEMRMSPRKSPAEEKKKGILSNLSKLSKIFSKKKKQASYY